MHEEKDYETIDGQRIDVRAVKTILGKDTCNKDGFESFVFELKAAKRGWLQSVAEKEKPEHFTKARQALNSIKKLTALLSGIQNSADFNFFMFIEYEKAGLKVPPCDPLIIADIELLGRLNSALENYTSKRKSGPSNQKNDHFLITRICEAYEHFTADKITHRAHDDNDSYNQGSFSSSGKKIMALTKLVSPSVRDAEIATALRGYIRMKRAKKSKV